MLQIKAGLPGTTIKRQFDKDSGEKLLSLMRMFSIKSFVEVGVLCGDMTEYLCNNYNFDKYYAIDIWLRTNYGLNKHSQEEMEIAYRFCQDRFKEFDNVKIIRADSISAAELLEDNSVDCVFIDAAHDTGSVTRDINAWFPKVKKLLIGHDYAEFGTVRKSVDLIFPQRKIHNNLWYVTK